MSIPRDRSNRSADGEAVAHEVRQQASVHRRERERAITPDDDRVREPVSAERGGAGVTQKDASGLHNLGG